MRKPPVEDWQKAWFSIASKINQAGKYLTTNADHCSCACI